MSFDYGFHSKDGKHHAEGWRTNTSVKVMQGYGGHPTAARPRRKALTVWAGRQPFMVEVPVLLWRGGQSVERDREELEEMAMGQERAPAREQISCTVSTGVGVTLPVPPGLTYCGYYPGGVGDWWLENLTWEDSPEEVRNRNGELLRKNVTVTLLERVDDVTLGEEASQRHGAGGRVVKRFVKPYTVKKGDTLHSIAARQLGNASRWTEITLFNPKVKSTANLFPPGHKHGGLVIKLPTYNAPAGQPFVVEIKAQPTTRG